LRRRYEEVHRLANSGKNSSQIHQLTGLSPQTIRKYLASPEVPKRAERRRVPTILDPFVDYLAERWHDGCHHLRSLYAEIVQQGYAGALPTLRRLVRPWRAASPPLPRPPIPPAPRKQDSTIRPVTWKQMRWAVLSPPEHLPDMERGLLTDFLERNPTLALAHELLQRFRRILAEQDRAAFATWLADTQQSNLPPFQRLARTLKGDEAAVLAAIGLPWSTGPVEGHINRVKLLKRIGYGRAGLSLLRVRIIGSAGRQSSAPARTGCAV
jgi:transposase